MKKNVSRKLIALGKKSKLLVVPSFILLFLFLTMYHFALQFKHNCRRIVSLVCVCIFFVMSSSFTYNNGDGDILNVSANVTSDEKMVNKDSNVETVSEAQLVKETDIIDDQDVTDGYENSEFEFVEDEERFSVDEILNENDNAIENSSTDTTVSLDKDDWKLVLINKQHPVPEDYTFTLGTIKGSMKCDERIIPDILAMLQAAKDDGINLVICSPYRDLKRQEVLFERKINAYMKKGMSYFDAYTMTSQTVTVPGASEHQIGMALDIICDSYSSLNEGFGDTEAGQWLKLHSCEYGFILRYPEGKEYITGIEYEPWHFRYVGKEAATQIKDQGITLEELVESLK